MFNWSPCTCDPGDVPRQDRRSIHAGGHGRIGGGNPTHSVTNRIIPRLHIHITYNLESHPSLPDLAPPTFLTTLLTFLPKEKEIHMLVFLLGTFNLFTFFKIQTLVFLPYPLIRCPPDARDASKPSDQSVHLSSNCPGDEY